MNLECGTSRYAMALEGVNEPLQGGRLSEMLGAESVGEQVRGAGGLVMG